MKEHRRKVNSSVAWTGEGGKAKTGCQKVASLSILQALMQDPSWGYRHEYNPKKENKMILNHETFCRE